MRTLAVIASLLVAIPAIAQPAPAPLAGDVLVWADAPLYLRPDVHGPSLQLVTLDGPRDQRIGHALPMHVVADHGELVEVEPTKGYHCTWEHFRAPLANLHLYVRHGDLAPVLTARFTKRFSDGTGLDLAPGTPVGRLGDRYAAALYGDAPAVPLVGAQVGFAYQPQPFDDPPDEQYALARGSTVSVSGHAVKPRDGWGSATAVRHGATTRIALATTCARMTVVARSQDVGWIDDTPLVLHAKPGALAALTGGERDYLPAGTALTSPDGTPLAVASAEIDVPPPGTARMVCAEVIVGSWAETESWKLDAGTAYADRTLQVCGPASAVRHLDPKKPW